MASPPRKRRSKRAPKDNVVHVGVANETSDTDFISRYMRPDANWTTWSHPKTEAIYDISLKGAEILTDPELEACLALVEETSGEDYRKSSTGWHPKAKREEMESPELRYILVKTAPASAAADADGEVPETEDIRGFLSIMPTFENGEPVVYVYEIHLRDELRGTGLGKQLMSYAKSTAANIPGIGAVMLTCFTANESGMQFYERLGFVEDESSPRERRLRGGKVVKPDYAILSWRCETNPNNSNSNADNDDASFE